MINCEECSNYKDCCAYPADFDLCVSNDWDRYEKKAANKDNDKQQGVK